MRLALPLLTLTLSLSSCALWKIPEGEGRGPVCPQGVSGQSLPASVSGAAVVPTPAAAADWTAPHVPGRVLVLGGGGQLGAQALNVLSAVRTQRVTGNLTLAVTPGGEGDRAFARRLEAAGLHVQPDYLYRALDLPDDPGYPGGAGVEVNGTTLFQAYLPRIRAEGAWEVLAACGKTPAAALTAVLDTGADGGHPDLGGRLLPGESYQGASATTDEEGHGTAVAGLIGAATNNGTGLAGVTWGGRAILPVKVLGPGGGSTSTIAEGMNYAVSQGAGVINLSLGRPGPSGQEAGDTALDNAINAAARSAVIVVAAGNSPNQGVYYPASNPNVIAVGAVGTEDGTLACYSARRGAGQDRDLDLVAPGGAGRGACPGATDDQDMLVLEPGGGYTLSAGTSEATPLVSGVAALMRAVNPGLSAPQVRQLLIESADRTAGLPLLDAEAAVRAATR